MDDSFFGFDTNLPEDGGNLPIIEPSEEEYDALNDETFGSAINGDWETDHESLVRLTDNLDDNADVLDNGANDEYGVLRRSVEEGRGAAGNIGEGFDGARRMKDYHNNSTSGDVDSLDLELAALKLDEMDPTYNPGVNENAAIGGRLLGGASSHLNVREAAWSSEQQVASSGDIGLKNQGHHPLNSMKSAALPFSTKTENARSHDPTDFIREHFSTPFQQATPLTMSSSVHGGGAAHGIQGMPPMAADPRFMMMQKDMKMGNLCRLEDIERGLYNQQQQQQQQQQQHGFNTDNNHGDGMKKDNTTTIPIGRETPTNAKLLNDSKPSTPSFPQRPPMAPPMAAPQMYLNQPQCSTKIRPCVINTQTANYIGQVIPMDSVQQSPQRTTTTSSNNNNNFVNNMARHPLNAFQQAPSHPPPVPPQPPFMNRMPSGMTYHAAPNKVVPPHLQPPGHQTHPAHLPPHPLLSQHHPGYPVNYPLPPVRPMSNSHLPIALNNFAMHPNFNAIRDSAAATGIHPAALLGLQQQGARMMGMHTPPPQPPPQMVLLNNQNSANTNNFNMFNMRLVQEIQQNHPLLQNTTRQVQQQQQQHQQHHQQQQQQQQQNMHGNNYHQNVNQNQNQNQNMSHNNNNNNGQQMQGQRNIGNKGLLRRDGNLPAEEFDEYANLMSTRDKHWLIGIQLSQLNTDTPYIDDYYYTIYKKRKLEENGDLKNSEAHKDNQLNHPLTQPKGHAQLILVQLGNKNGLRNGHQHNHRMKSNGEQHNNHSSGGGGGGSSNSGGGGGGGMDLKLPAYLLTPLKFENSLGKLQCVSVTAPRKIIDAEIMNNDLTTSTCVKGTTYTTPTGTGAATTTTTTGSSGNNEDNRNTNNGQLKSRTAMNNNNNNNTSTMNSMRSNVTGGSELSAASNVNQRKCRHILLHIENLYRLVLKLDDLNDPLAVATILAKKKKENERIAALEQLEQSAALALTTGTNDQKSGEDKSTESVANNNNNNNNNNSNPALKSKFNYDLETKEELIEKLLTGLKHDKVVAMMNVRKGKILLRRIIVYLEEHENRWQVWLGIFNALQVVLKRDREDSEGILYAFYPEFKKQIQLANFEMIVKLAEAIALNDSKRSTGVLCNKFGILSLVCLILQAERIYTEQKDSTLTEKLKKSWRLFLDQVANFLNRTMQNQTICAAIESNSIKPIMHHFARFKDLKLDSLLALITEAKTTD